MIRNDYLAEAIAATAPQYLQGRSDLTARAYNILNWIISHGKVVYNASGYDLNWKVTAFEPETQTVNGQRPEFTSTPTEVDLRVDYAKLRATDVLDEDTIMVNSGPTQIVNIAEKKVDQLLDAMGKRLNRQFYNDDTVDVNGLTGIRSLFRPQVGAATDRIAIPTSGATYGGKSMTLGNLGGSWSANLVSGARYNSHSSLLNDWPEGDGSPEYDYLAPLMFNTTGNWGQATNTWRNNCEVILRRIGLFIDSRGGTGGTPNLCILPKTLIGELRDSVNVRERLFPSDYAKGLGMSGLETYEGMEILHDFNCPSDRGYCMNVNMMELFVQTSELFYLDGPTWDIREEAYLMALKMKGNFRWKPKYFAEMASYT